MGGGGVGVHPGLMGGNTGLGGGGVATARWGVEASVGGGQQGGGGGGDISTSKNRPSHHK